MRVRLGRRRLGCGWEDEDGIMQILTIVRWMDGQTGGAWLGLDGMGWDRKARLGE
jgi:hypothetical protein